MEDRLHVLADVAGLGQRRGVGDGEGDAEVLGQGLGQVGLPRARWGRSAGRWTSRSRRPGGRGRRRSGRRRPWSMASSSRMKWLETAMARSAWPGPGRPPSGPGGRRSPWARGWGSVDPSAGLRFGGHGGGHRADGDRRLPRREASGVSAGVDLYRPRRRDPDWGAVATRLTSVRFAPAPADPCRASGSTGLTRWWSKPASLDRRRSASWPQPVRATISVPLELGPLPQPPGHLVAVHARQADVQQDDLGPELLGDVQGLGAVVGDPHLLAVEPRQQPGQAAGGVHVVVHHQDAAAGRPGRPASPAIGLGPAAPASRAARGPAAGRRTRCPCPARRCGPRSCRRASRRAS